ncbi:MAG: NAD(P)H-quinone oxidoreductase [Alphaproteobacteria bacterium]|jgi:putative PIG3 family NAD(P)H quinone oxidoreductase
MKAIVITDNKLNWVDNEDPDCKDNEVIIKVKATAVNRADLAQRVGLYPAPPGASEILGLECSGIIQEIGRNVVNRKVGDEVVALLAGGGYAEYVSCPEVQTLPLPKNINLNDGAAIPEVFATCWLNLFIEGNLKKGEKVLFHAGASGIGTAGIQLCNIFQCESYITAGSEEKVEFCIDLGSNAGTVRLENSFKSFKDHCPSGLDIILDPVGANYFEENLNNLAIDGRLIIIGILGGVNGKINIGNLLMKRQKIIGSTIRSRSIEVKGKVMNALYENIWDHFEKKIIKPIIYKKLPIREADQAHKIMENNNNIGKIILEVF